MSRNMKERMNYMEVNKIVSIIKDNTERKNIIERYNIDGYLDRDDAIKKIQSLRMTNVNVAEATAATLI